MTGPATANEGEGARFAAEPGRFDIAGALPGQGVTLLEASAGTGKTYTIAALVCRYIAEGYPIESILTVTFTRMATAELRWRVRDRLVAAEERLGRLLDRGIKDPAMDRLDELLASGSRAEAETRRSRLSTAISNFDSATIATTHGFCHLVLASLGVAGVVRPDARLIEDARDVTDEVLEDLYTRWSLTRGRPFTLPEARRAVVAALQNLDTDLAPAPPETVAGLQRRLASRAREEVDHRLTTANLLTYDHLLVRLATALANPDQGEIACRILRDRYRVVLVDEFQDTDPTQWRIVRKAFSGGSTVLVLIGDPKQAIYSFRGGDVFAYLGAAKTATTRHTLGENWRSDAGLLAAYDALLAPVQLGHPEIPYRKLTVPPAHREAGLVGTHVIEPVRVRVLFGNRHAGLTTNQYGVAKASAEAWIAEDLVSDVVQLLKSGARLTRGPDGPGSPRRVLCPRDIAVLVRTNKQAQKVEAALIAAGVPAVMGSSDTVFATAGARHWLRLLEAIEQPASRSRAAAAALTPFFGRPASQVALADDQAWEQIHSRLHQWGEKLRSSGVASLYQQALADEEVPSRVLKTAGGARTLTDLAHIAQLLHAERSTGLVGASALRTWLNRRARDAEQEAEIEDRTRRLDTDAEAVQILTVHRAKGLEFPVVYCPYLWDCGRNPDQDDPVVYHDTSACDSRMLDVGSAEKPAPFIDHHALAVEERRAEDLRLLYVALTRARHQAVLWWARAKDSNQSPLGRLLMCRHPDGSVATTARRSFKESEVEAELRRRSEAAPGLISVERSEQPRPERWDPPVPAPTLLAAAEFQRRLDLSWRRTSYSAIVAAGRAESASAVRSEAEDPGTVDEPGAVSPSRVTGDHGRRIEPGQELPMGALPGGADFGTFSHRVLAQADFAAPDLAAELSRVIESEWPGRPDGLEDPAALVSGLVAALDTPLGPLTGGIPLRGIQRRDRLDEMRFELPLAGGDQPRGEVTVEDIAWLLESNCSEDELLSDYARHLASPHLASSFRGYLTGSLDLVFRAGHDGAQRFYVVDYKTNRLAPEAETLSLWHYRREALDAEMQHSHYLLQAILYSVALHRYLRWRVPDYDPARHLGGVLYLFVRGMIGAGAPTLDGNPFGVFSWKPHAPLVTGLSDLFGSGRG